MADLMNLTVGIIAGSGVLPRLIAEARAAAGAGYHVVALEGAAGDWVSGHPHSTATLGKVGGILSSLRKAGCEAIVFAGGLARPSLATLTPDWKGAMLAPRITRLFAQGGDDALLRGIAEIFEEEGFRVLGAHELLQGLLAPVGAIGRLQPSAQDLADVERAAEIVRTLGALDVGQGAVVAHNLCLAMEAIEGTDGMLARVAALPKRRRSAAPPPSGVLFKAPKPGQDRRVDLPAVGPDTMRAAKEAGLNGVAVEAGGVFILGMAETARAADEAGLFLWGRAPGPQA